MSGGGHMPLSHIVGVPTERPQPVQDELSLVRGVALEGELLQVGHCLKQKAAGKHHAACVQERHARQGVGLFVAGVFKEGRWATALVREVDVIT